MGFVEGEASLFVIHSDGEVTEHQNFAAIGSGHAIAEAMLYLRGLNIFDRLEKTLYTLYEAAQQVRIAPGVGEIGSLFVLVQPPKNRL